MIRKSEVLEIIDDVVNRRDLAAWQALMEIRRLIEEYNDGTFYAKLKLRGEGGLCCTRPYFRGATHVCIDTMEKIDTGRYGTYWYE